MIPLGQPKWLLAISTALLLGGTLLVISSRQIAERAKSLPRMTCNDLTRLGRAAPQFITLTDLRLCQGGHAFRRDMDAAMEMYVPAYSTTLKKQPPAADLALVLEVLDDRQRNWLLETPELGELNVELWTDAGKLDPWVRDSLAAMYPGLRLANCRVLSVGLHEPSAQLAQSELQEGVALLLLAAACQLGGWMWRRFGQPLQHVAMAACVD